MVQYGGAADGMEIGRHGECPVTEQLEVLADFKTCPIRMCHCIILSMSTILICL